MNKPLVAITQAHAIQDRAEIRAALHTLLRYLEIDKELQPGARILLKLNLCLIKGAETGATSDPFVIRCLVEWLLEHVDPAEIILAESDATHLSADIAYRVLGWEAYFSDLPRVRWLNLSQDEMVTVHLDGLQFEQLEMSRTYMQADYLISCAKLKTHTQERITCTMKNLFGSWPRKVKIVYHPVLDKVICDLTRVRRPDLCLVDGIIAHEGAGPVDGVPKPLGLLIAGNDPIATDHVCAQVMGFRPQQVPHLRLALQSGLGSADYQLLGRPLSAVRTRFDFIPAWQRGWTAFKERLGAT